MAIPIASDLFLFSTIVAESRSWYVGDTVTADSRLAQYFLNDTSLRLKLLELMDSLKNKSHGRGSCF
jgi:hypothetical protein